MIRKNLRSFTLSTLDLPKKEEKKTITPPHFKQNLKNRVREKGGAEAVQKAREKREGEKTVSLSAFHVLFGGCV